MDAEHGTAAGTWPGYVDWRNRPALKSKHGGMAAASFVLVAEVLENMAHHACMANMVRYLSNYMNYTPAEASMANANFIGTGFLLALFGGFLSDAVCTSYALYPIAAAVEALGLLVLCIQAYTPSLQPPKCQPLAGACAKVSGTKAAVLYTGLYLVALGVGGIKGSLPSHGAEQFDDSTAKGRQERSTFFNYFVFCLAFGALIAVTFVVWVEDNLGWQWGFAMAGFGLLLSIPLFLSGSRLYRNKLPAGSPITTIAKVIWASVLGSKTAKKNGSTSVAMEVIGGTPAVDSKEEEDAILRAEKRHRDGAKRSTACTPQEVEDVKVVAKIMPIFLCTIMLSCCLAQFSGFSVQQAATMDSQVGALLVPPASLPIFPITFIMVLAPIYDHAIVPFARKITGTESGITHLQRIGTGLVFSILAMAVAAVVEVKRKGVAIRTGLADTNPKLPISVFWMAPQFLFLGSADLFTQAGMLEFFFTEAPEKMRTLATALSYASLALGYYLSSVLVWIVNTVTGAGDNKPWLSGQNLNHYGLEKYYWLMSVLSVLNFLNYLFWASRYKYRSRAHSG